VAVYLPMLPETAVAMLAIAKLGAVFVPVFSGYGAPAVAARLTDCAAAALITADGAYRRGKPVDRCRWVVLRSTRKRRSEDAIVGG